jgi:hypothetical protein
MSRMVGMTAVRTTWASLVVGALRVPNRQTLFKRCTIPT